MPMNPQQYTDKIAARARRDGYHIVTIVAESPEGGYAIQHIPGKLIMNKTLAAEFAKWLILTIGPDPDRIADILSDATKEAISEAESTLTELEKELKAAAEIQEKSEFIRELTRRDACKPR